MTFQESIFIGLFTLYNFVIIFLYEYFYLRVKNKKIKDKRIDNALAFNSVFNKLASIIMIICSIILIVTSNYEQNDKIATVSVIAGLIALPILGISYWYIDVKQRKFVEKNYSTISFYQYFKYSIITKASLQSINLVFFIACILRALE